MSGTFFRLLLVITLSSTLFACGGGGGGGGGTASSSSAPLDTDKDGHPDTQDAFPNDPKEWKDSDGDGVGDNGDAFPNDASESKDSDGDGVGDNGDAFPNDASESKDSDGDGVGDNADAFPNDASESKDSDGDGVGDNRDAFPNDASEFLDSDGDGVGDYTDLFPHDATETVDTDGDGVGDNGDAFPNDPNESADSDGDGVGDNADAFPNDANETVDTDGDGIGDNGDTTPLGAEIPAWSSFQGNANHNAQIDITLDQENFAQRWSKTLSLSYLAQGAAGDGYLFFNSGGKLYALNMESGNIVWQRQVVTNNQPAYANGKVYLESSSSFWSFAAATGEQLSKTTIENQSSQFYAPTPFANGVYFGGGYYGGIYAVDGSSGAQLWWRSTNQYDGFTPAVTDNYVISYTGEYAPQLTVASRATGEDLFTIADNNFYWNGWTMNQAPVVAGNKVVVTQHGRLICFDLTSQSIAWEISENFNAQAVIQGEAIYVINNGVLQKRSLSDGQLLSSITGSNTFNTNFILSNNLVFIGDSSNVYAYDLSSGSKLWTLTNKSGKLMLADGALIIIRSSGITAINVDGNIDGDSLPDWWEKRYHKNLTPEGDNDQDGLSNSEEFALGTNPLVADSDGDGLSDGEEVNTHHTSPLLSDSDEDGLSDSEEINSYATNPNAKDSDGDGADDALEIQLGLNPNLLSDATGDDDGDGYSNLHELLAGTATDNAESFPQASDWAMLQANASHSGFQPVVLNNANFALRWSKTLPFYINGLATGDNQVFATPMSWFDDGKIRALKVTDGEPAWEVSFGQVASISPPSYADGKVYVHTGGHADTALRAVDSGTGAFSFTTELSSQWPSYLAPTLFANHAYMNGGYTGGMATVDTSSGLAGWFTGDATWTDGWEPAVNSETVFFPRGNSLVAANRSTGQESFVLETQNTSVSPVLGELNDLLVSGTYLTSFDLSSQSVRWEAADYPISGIPAVGNHKVYFISQGKLVCLDETTGNLLWSWQSGDTLTSNVLVTLTHVFVATGANTYALSAATGAQLWSYNRGGNLALGKDLALYIYNNDSLTAVDVQGDSDDDGMPDWWELAYGLNPRSGDDAALDKDSDGLSNLAEFNQHTDPTQADSDGDGLSDGDEVNSHHTDPLSVDSDLDNLSDYDEVISYNTNPLLSDSDSDGLADGIEVAAGLNPLNGNDATADADSDGYNNGDEVLAGTDMNNASSYPQLSNWSMVQGNASHNGFQPVRLDSSAFSLRWSQSAPLRVEGLAVSSKKLVVSGYSAAKASEALVALNTLNGSSQWTSELVADSMSPPRLSNDKAYVHIGGQQRTALLGFDLQTGTQLVSAKHGGQWPYYLAPTLFDNKAYMNGGTFGGLVGKDAESGAELWPQVSATWVDGWEPAVNQDYVYYPADNSLSYLNRATGEVLGQFSYAATGRSPVLGALNDIIVSDTSIKSFDLSSKNLRWQTGSLNLLQLPAVGNHRVYYQSQGSLYCRDELSGTQLWSWTPSFGEGLSGNIIVTLSHIFVASDNYTYALDAQTGALAWSYNRGGQLALGPDEALYIYNESNLTAINLSGDADNDGMPDWWEKANGLDPQDPSDASDDSDSDTLSNLDEFNYQTDPNLSDSDDDGLDDAEEVNTYGTNPTLADSDGDQMTDGWEVSYGLDPLDEGDRNLDSDGDGINNFFEFSENTEPNNALSMPALYGFASYSFEDQQLPSGWALSSQTSYTSIDDTVAQEGSYSLQSGSTSSLEFSGFFSSTDISLWASTNCSYSATVSIVIDGVVQASSTELTSGWRKLTSVIPFGRHQVAIQSNSYGCNVYIDNIQLTEAQGLVDAGVLLLGINNGTLSFVDSNVQVIKTLKASLPEQNLNASMVTPIGTDKVAAVFSGSPLKLGILDLTTYEWRYYTPAANISGNLQQIAYSNNNLYLAFGYYAYGSSVQSGLVKFNLADGSFSALGSLSYSAVNVDSSGNLYAGIGSTIVELDQNTGEVLQSFGVAYMERFAVSPSGSLTVLYQYNLLTYNAQHLLESSIQLDNYAQSLSYDNEGNLYVSSSGYLYRYSPDMELSSTTEVTLGRIVAVQQPDTDSDTIPDWWELKYSLDPDDSGDASSDNDSDDLSAAEEYAQHTNPQDPDTDGDLLTDGDEVNTYGTNPTLADTDADGLTDAEELLTHNTDPLKKDTDGDGFSDGSEILTYFTNPTDSNSKPDAIVNFTQSFEGSFVDWTMTAGANASWAQAADRASDGSYSLKSQTIADYQNASIEWEALFGSATLTFNYYLESESCCDYLQVYVDDQLSQQLSTQGGWTQVSFNLTQGTHKIRFTYHKDGSVSYGADAAWIDNLRVTPN